jgi:hypothetical protein
VGPKTDGAGLSGSGSVCTNESKPGKGIAGKAGCSSVDAVAAGGEVDGASGAVFVCTNESKPGKGIAGKVSAIICSLQNLLFLHPPFYGCLTEPRIY